MSDGPYETRIEPNSGVPVLTMNGFFQKIADQDGKTAAEVSEEVFTTIEEALAEDEAWYRNPLNAQITLRQAVRENNCAMIEERAHTKRMIVEGRPGYAILDLADYQPMPAPKRILEVLEVRVGGGLAGGESLLIRARATRFDGVGIIELATWSSGYSYWEPPDGETQVWWHDETDEST